MHRRLALGEAGGGFEVPRGLVGIAIHHDGWTEGEVPAFSHLGELHVADRGVVVGSGRPARWKGAAAFDLLVGVIVFHTGHTSLRERWRRGQHAKGDDLKNAVRQFHRPFLLGCSMVDVDRPPTAAQVSLARTPYP